MPVKYKNSCCINNSRHRKDEGDIKLYQKHYLKHVLHGTSSLPAYLFFKANNINRSEHLLYRVEVVFSDFSSRNFECSWRNSTSPDVHRLATSCFFTNETKPPNNLNKKGQICHRYSSISYTVYSDTWFRMSAWL